VFVLVSDDRAVSKQRIHQRYGPLMEMLINNAEYSLNKEAILPTQLAFVFIPQYTSLAYRQIYTTK